MHLSTEMILTLQQLDGIGNKTIFNQIAKYVTNTISQISQLCEFWITLKGKKIQAITEDDLYKAHDVALRIIERCKEENVGIISYYDSKYPEILKSCTNEDGKIDPPLILYYKGNLEALRKPGVAIIGTREPTPNGIKAGLHFSREFAKRGYNIVSGLAIGCDATGHQGALSVGGTTTAFLAIGLDWAYIYPKENLSLAKEIVSNGGLLLSEYPVGQSCGRYSLVARDRLQAGLSYATIVIQTGIKGGTMHAVNATINSQKPLFAVEFKNNEDTISEKVQGNLKLVQEGQAHPLRSSEIDEAKQLIESYINKAKQNQQESLFPNLFS